MANCFFVDFENVHDSGLSNLKNLNKDDRIFIFYTENSDKIRFDSIIKLNKLCCGYELIKVPAGSQSLDMHLISFVGYKVGACGKKFDYVVISKDTDYDNVISFWKQKCNVNMKRQAILNQNSPKTAANVPKAKSGNQSPVAASVQKANSGSQPSASATVPKANSANKSPAAPNVTPRNSDNHPPASTTVPKANTSNPSAAAASAPQANSGVLPPAESESPEKIQTANKPAVAVLQHESVKAAAKMTESCLEQDIEKVLLGAGYSRDAMSGVIDAVSSGIAETNPLSSVHANLQKTLKDFTAIYKLIKPAVSKYLKSATR
ncbi:MAG: hypothetical protein IJ523_03470 [Succinivibrionaceae bacterium]|nr:hypothetical protein [Succinivibrionaceae bacterium]